MSLIFFCRVGHGCLLVEYVEFNLQDKILYSIKIIDKFKSETGNYIRFIQEVPYKILGESVLQEIRWNG